MSFPTGPRPLPPIPATGARPVIPEARQVRQTLDWLRAEHTAGLGSTTAPTPLLGSAAWCALADADPAKWCAVLAAAMAWFREQIELPGRLLTELLDEHDLREQAVSEAFAGFGAAVENLRRSCASRPDFAELHARRSTYTTPALTPEQIRAKARASWAEFEARPGIGAAA